MKISSNNFFNPQPSINQQKKACPASFTNVMNTKNKNCDQIIISSKNKPSDSDSFTENLVNDICQEVRTSVSSDKLENLKKEIINGTYKIDTDEIAAKIIQD